MIWRWLVLDIGCLECRIDTEVVGVYPSKDEADQAAAAYTDKLWGPSSEWAKWWATRHPERDDTPPVDTQHDVQIFAIHVDADASTHPTSGHQQ